MKKAITYSLLFLFSLAFSYETLTYFSKKLSEDFQTSVNDYESESDSESDDESEKKELLEGLYLNESHDLTIASQANSAHFIDFIFSSSDYSQTIYSPPEQAIL